MIPLVIWLFFACGSAAPNPGLLSGTFINPTTGVGSTSVIYTTQVHSVPLIKTVQYGISTNLVPVYATNTNVFKSPAAPPVTSAVAPVKTTPGTSPDQIATLPVVVAPTAPENSPPSAATAPVLPVSRNLELEVLPAAAAVGTDPTSQVIVPKSDAIVTGSQAEQPATPVELPAGSPESGPIVQASVLSVSEPPSSTTASSASTENHVAGVPELISPAVFSTTEKNAQEILNVESTAAPAAGEELPSSTVASAPAGGRSLIPKDPVFSFPPAPRETYVMYSTDPVTERS